MARKTLIRSNVFPYHVTARSNNKDPFPLPLDAVWKIITDELLLLQVLYGIEVHGLVLMPNHFHLLLTTPREDLGKVMNMFMADVTRLSHYQSGRSGHFFGGPYWWSIITSPRYYGHVFKYVYRNPVKAKLCRSVEEYEFSTLGSLLGFTASRFPIHFTRSGMEINLPDPQCVGEWLDWLNTPFKKEVEELIQKVMMKREINCLMNMSTRRPYEVLESRV